MTNPRALTQNIRQVFSGVPSQDKIVATARKKQQSVFLPLTMVTAIVTVIISTFWLNSLVFMHQPNAQEVGVNFLEKISPVEQTPSFTIPVRLRIESADVDAVIEPVGLTIDGAMDTPNKATTAGWFNIGPHPGEMGSAVIAGHFDAEDGTAGVFQKLHLLKVGDEVSIIDSTEISRTFVVVGSRVYDWDEDVPEVFYRADGRYLNLITCSGAWSSTKEKYEQRLVVFTALKQ